MIIIFYRLDSMNKKLESALFELDIETTTALVKSGEDLNSADMGLVLYNVFYRNFGEKLIEFIKVLVSLNYDVTKKINVAINGKSFSLSVLQCVTDSMVFDFLVSEYKLDSTGMEFTNIFTGSDAPNGEYTYVGTYVGHIARKGHMDMFPVVSSDLGFQIKALVKTFNERCNSHFELSDFRQDVNKNYLFTLGYNSSYDNAIKKCEAYLVDTLSFRVFHFNADRDISNLLSVMVEIELENLLADGWVHDASSIAFSLVSINKNGENI